MASAAYRAGEKLHSEYYGEISDYTRKGGVICSEILLPSHAPSEYADRETLWNAVEKAERGKKAQLAYSFDIALQNEFSMQENIALARQFLLENFVSRGMVVDFAVHSPDKEDVGISNPHFHVMCPIRPLDEHGRWGNKQRREYVLDEHGERIRDEAGNYVFNAVPTTDWGSPETLEHWRQAWAYLCNAKFSEKDLDCRIDHRSYERQGIEQIPTVHEGPSVRAMEAKGIRTDKGDFNRWVRKTNAMLREVKNKIASLLKWLKAVIRKVFLPKTVALALVEAKRRQQEIKEMLANGYQDFDLVIAHEDGRPYEERQIAFLLRKLTDATGLPPVVFHSLRHCSASLKLQIGGGNIKAVQGDTGHAQSRMVTDLYAHTNNEERRRLAEKVEADFFQKRADTPQEKPLDNTAEQAYRLLQENPDIAKLIIATLQKQA